MHRLHGLDSMHGLTGCTALNDWMHCLQQDMHNLLTDCYIFSLYLPEVSVSTAGTNVLCLQFFRHMFGSGMGSLSVTVSDNSGTRSVWYENKPAGNKWHFESETVSVQGDAEVIFTAC